MEHQLSLASLEVVRVGKNGLMTYYPGLVHTRTVMGIWKVGNGMERFEIVKADELGQDVLY